MPNWLEVKVLLDSVCVVTRARRRPSKSFGPSFICAPVGGRVSFVFVMSFVDSLHEGQLPISRLHVGFPYAIEE